MQVTLFDSTYSRDEALDILVSVLKHKINFIKIQILQREERAEDTIELRKRIPLLEAEIKQVKEKLKDKNLNYRLSSKISVDAEEVG